MCSRYPAPAIVLLAIILHLVLLGRGWYAASTNGTDGTTTAGQPGDRDLIITDVPDSTPAAKAGLRVGDRIVAIAGVPVEDAGAFSQAAAAPPGTPLVYRVLPAGSSDPNSAQDVTVVLEPWTAELALVGPFVTFTLAGTLTLLVGSLVLLVRERDRAARLLFLIGVCAAVMLDCAIWVDSEYLPVVEWAHFLAATLVSCLLVHLFLVFPAPHRLYTRLAGLGVPLLYAIPVGASVPVGIVLGFGWAYILDGLIVAFAVPALVASYRHPASPVARAQLKWLIGAIVLLLVVLIVTVGVPTALTGTYPFISLAIVTLAWCAFPISIGLAVLRYGLFDVDSVLRASVTYALLAGVLVAGYVALAFALGRLGALLAGPTASADPSLSVLAALIVAAAAHPLRQRLQGGLDRLIYRRPAAVRALVNDAAERLSQAQPLANIAEFLGRLAPGQLDLTGGCLKLAFDAPVPPACTLALPAASPALLSRIASVQEPIVLAADKEIAHARGLRTMAAGDADAATWYASGARVLVPLHGSSLKESPANSFDSESLVGVWALGGRRSGDLLDRADLEAIQRVGRQAAILLDYLRLGQEQASQELVRRELARARELQRGLLPASLPAWPGRLDVAALLRPARETSGDFYDVIPLQLGSSDDGPSPIGLAVADVAGKGIAAALVMAMARTTLRAAALDSDCPSTVLDRTGAMLHRDVGPRDFVACCMAFVAPTAQGVRLRVANAGQVPPLWCRDGTAVELDPGGQRLPLGVLPDPSFAELTLDLGPGQAVVFASDGLPEAPAGGLARGELFGFERLAAAAANWSKRGNTAAEIADGIWSDIVRWCGPDADHDDMTLLVARVPTSNGQRSDA